MNVYECLHECKSTEQDEIETCSQNCFDILRALVGGKTRL